MAITVRSTSTGPNPNATSITASLPTGTTTGDVTVASFITGSNSPTTSLTFTPPSGWNVLANAGGVLVCWRAFQSGDPASITVTVASATWLSAAMISYTGLDTAAPIDAVNSCFNYSQNLGSGVVYASPLFRAPSVSPSFDGSRLLVIYGEAGSTGKTISLPSGLTSRASYLVGPNLLMCDKALTDGTQTGGINATGTASTNIHFGIQIALKAAGAAAATRAAPIPELSGFYSYFEAGTSVSLPLSLLNVQDGDLVVMAASHGNTGVSSAPTGYTSVINNAAASIWTHTWRTGDSVAPSFTFSGSARHAVDVWLVRKVGTGVNTAIVDQSGSAVVTAVNAVTAAAPSLTPSGSGELLLVHFGTGGNQQAGAWSATSTTLTDYDINSATGPGVRTGGLTPSPNPSGTYSATWTSSGVTTTLSATSVLFAVASATSSAARPQVFVCT